MYMLLPYHSVLPEYLMVEFESFPRSRVIKATLLLTPKRAKSVRRHSSRARSLPFSLDDLYLY